VIIGASLSDGFHYKEMKSLFRKPKSNRLSLEHYFGRALTVPYGTFSNYGSSTLFLAVDPLVAQQMKNALEKKPTVVIAPDFLFWFVYGISSRRGPDLDALSSQEFLARGLDYLDQFQCPLVLGDIPNCKRAVGGILDRREYPGSEWIEQANVKIHKWAAKRPNRKVVSIATFYRKASENQEMLMFDQKYAAGHTRATFLQRDQLHPTEKGAAVITLLMLEGLKGLQKIPESAIKWKIDELLP